MSSKLGGFMPDRPFNGMPLVRPTVSPSPATPPKQLGTVRIDMETSKKEALIQAVARIQELEIQVRAHLENAARGVEVVRSQKAQIETLKKENQTLKDTLEAWQAVVRVAREKDSTLPDPESSL